MDDASRDRILSEQFLARLDAIQELVRPIPEMNERLGRVEERIDRVEQRLDVHCFGISSFNAREMAGYHVGNLMGQGLGGLIAINVVTDADVPGERLVVAVGGLGVLAGGGNAVQLEVVQEVGVESHAGIRGTVDHLRTWRLGGGPSV